VRSCARTSTAGWPSTGATPSSPASPATGEAAAHPSCAQCRARDGSPRSADMPCALCPAHKLSPRAHATHLQQHILCAQRAGGALQQLWRDSTHPQEAPGPPHKGACLTVCFPCAGTCVLGGCMVTVLCAHTCAGPIAGMLPAAAAPPLLPLCRSWLMLSCCCLATAEGRVGCLIWASLRRVLWHGQSRTHEEASSRRPRGRLCGRPCAQFFMRCTVVAVGVQRAVPVHGVAAFWGQRRPDACRSASASSAAQLVCGALLGGGEDSTLSDPRAAMRCGHGPAHPL
jgi:hypothetical protein